MGYPISIRKRTMVMKQQATRGTALPWSTPWTDADVDIPFFNIQPTRELAEYQRIYAMGDHDTLASVFGKQSAKVTASVDLAGSGDADTPPKLRKLFCAAGLLETVNASTSVTYAPDKSADLGGGLANALSKPWDIAIQDEAMGHSPKAVITLISGALCNLKLIMAEGGQPIRLNAEFTGVLAGMEDEATAADILVPTGYDTTVPSSVLSATITRNSVAQRINTLEFDLGNQIALENDPSKAQGLLAAYIYDRKPTISLDPLADIIATDPVWTNWLAGTETALALSFSHWALAAEKAQIITAADAEQDGARAWDLKLALNRGTTHPWLLTHT